MRRKHYCYIACILAIAPLIAWMSNAGTVQQIPVAINATQLGEPISQYIYGQFIEHLGRCIYGGLWAEMLEDRKFYFPITGEAPAWEWYTPGNISWEGEGHPYELLVRSPWMILGDNTTVTMEKDNSFV